MGSVEIFPDTCVVQCTMNSFVRAMNLLEVIRYTIFEGDISEGEFPVNSMSDAKIDIAVVASRADKSNISKNARKVESFIGEFIPGPIQLTIDKEQFDIRCCAFCGERPNRLGASVDEDRLSKCSACLKVGYCNRECQKKHWKIHKHVCGKN